MLWAILFTTGVAVGVVSTGAPIPDLAAAVGLLFVWLGAGRRPGWPLAARRRAARAAAGGMVLLAGAAWGAHARDAETRGELAGALGGGFALGNSTAVTLDGALTDDAAIDAESVLLRIAVRRVEMGGVWRRAAGRATVSVRGAGAAEQAAQWTRGRRVIASVVAHRPQMFFNPGATSERWRRLTRRAEVSATAKSAALIEVTPAGWWEESLARVRAFVRARVAARVAPWSEESSAIVTAILIGDRTALDDELTLRLQRAGTFHVIAISGGNIALVLVAVLVAARTMSRSPRAPLVIAAVVIGGYGELVSAQASVARAVTAAEVVLLVEWFGWVLPPRQVFWLAAAVVVAADPLAVADAGAWLSFGATLGIVTFAAPIARWLSRDSPRRAVRTAATLAAATLAAELIVAPITARVFSQMTVAGVVLNFIAVPAMAVTQAAGIAAVIAPDAGGLARVAGLAAHAGVMAITRSARLVEWWPQLSWLTPPVATGWLLAYAAALWCAWRLAARAMRGAALVVAAGALAVIAGAPLGPPAGLPPSGWLRVTTLDVGQGDAILVQFPTGQSLLVDAGGSLTGFDVGARVVRPALWALGVRRLDWLAITHGDLDHAGGAASVAAAFHPRQIWEGVPVPSNATLQHLRAVAPANGAAWQRLVAGGSIEAGSARIDVRSPPRPDWERPSTRNEDSLVLRLAFGDVAIWLTGDAGGPVEQALIAESLAGDPARLRVLKVGHHGSRTATSAAWLDYLRPQIALVSAGRGNVFGHPAPDVVERLEAAGAAIFRTDRDGAVVLETDGRRLRVGGVLRRVSVW